MNLRPADQHSYIVRVAPSWPPLRRDPSADFQLQVRYHQPSRKVTVRVTIEGQSIHRLVPYAMENSSGRRSQKPPSPHRLDISERFPTHIAGASLVRLAHCQVRVTRQAHFLRAQAQVWNPAMTGSAGMRGGVFAQRGEAEFLVLSLWRSTLDHERYLSERFPDLRRRSGAADDLDNITADLVDLEPAWTVPA